jgi:arylsulfatase
MRRSFTAIVVAAVYAVAGLRVAHAEQESATRRPNIVVIMIDDMGYSDPGCYGGEIETPHIDSLAENGVRFSQFYNCSRCCQTRASLLTGAYAQRVGMAEFGRTMNLEVPTLAERLKAAGYRTGLMGKWHLSELPGSPEGEDRIRWLDHRSDLNVPFAQAESLPTRRGFDEFFGIVWGVVDHFDPFSLCDGETPMKEVPEDFYLPDAISERSAKFIQDAAAADEPFFLYVAYDAPHWPIQAPAETIAKYDGKYDQGWDEVRRERFKGQTEMGLFDESTPLGEVSSQGPAWRQVPKERQAYLADKMEVHAAMVDHVDQGVGKIVESLRDAKLLDNTIVFFLSDNGSSPEIPGEAGYDRNAGTRDGRPALREAALQQAGNRDKLGSEESYAGIGPGWASATNTPLRYWKMESYEGGCRTPLVVHWPAGLKQKPGSIVRDAGHVIDIAPTCLDIAGVEVDGSDSGDAFQMDGVSLRPVLAATGPVEDRTLYFMHNDGRGVRRGKYKASKRHEHGWELFDLEKDPGETHDISGEEPEVLNSLVRELGEWRDKIRTEERERTAESQ